MATIIQYIMTYHGNSYISHEVTSHDT